MIPAARPLSPLHRVASDTGCNAPSPRYVGPVLANGELCLGLDENGLMHDFEALPGRPGPRLYWAGRRLRNPGRTMVPFGFFAATPSWEWLASTRWEQLLDVRRGVVATTHERGAALDQTETLVMLDRNLIAVHKSIHRAKGHGAVTARYRLCPPRSVDLPEGVSLTAGGSDAQAAWLAYRLAGVVAHDGRIALWADRPCQTSCRGNELQLVIPVNPNDDAVTFYLALVDDLGDERFYSQTGWAGRHRDHPVQAPIIRDLIERPVTKTDPDATLQGLRQWTATAGWAGVAAEQARLWGEFWGTGWLELPDAPDVQAVWETGMYLVRSQLTQWSMPVLIHGDCFNGMYFPDELAGAKALLQAGHWRLVERLAEHRLSVVPLGMQALDGVGARQDAPTCEGGYFSMAPMGCSLYEVHATAEPPTLVWAWLQYAAGDRAQLARYYPVFWGAAEFFRRWMVYQGADGEYFTGACVDFNESVPAVINGVATRAAAAGAMRLAATVAERLGRDPELVPVWRELAASLSRSPRLNSRGLLAQYEGDEGVSFTSVRLLQTPFTFGNISPRDPIARRTLAACLKDCKTSENWAVAASHNLELAKRSQDVRNPDPVAWTWLAAEAVGLCAFGGDPVTAAEILDELLRWRLNFGALYECKVLTDGFVSLPVFTTSNVDLSAAISMMLIQCDGDRIDLLPAVPPAWHNLSFKLAATNRTSVAVTVRDGRLTALRLLGPAGRRTVRLPAASQPEQLLGRASRRDGDWLSFELPVEPEETRP